MQVLGGAVTPYDPPDPSNPARLVYGIVLAITPTDSTQLVELHRQGDSAGSPDGNDVLVDSRLYRKSGDVFVDALPNDNVKRWYRWRHVLNAGETVGTYTAWVFARPALMPATFPTVQAMVVNDRALAMTDGSTSLAATDAAGQNATSDVYIGSAHTVIVGTAASPSSLTKKMRFQAYEFVPRDSTIAWAYGALPNAGPVNPDGALKSAAMGVTTEYEAPLPFPIGVTLTNLAVNAKTRSAPNSTCKVQIWKADNGGGMTNLVTVTVSAGGGFYNIGNGALSELTDSSHSYYAYCTADAPVAAGDTMMLWIEITYTMPSYDKGY